MVRIWIAPVAGGFYDFESGDYYSGERMITLHRKLDEVAVLAREGAIVPLAHRGAQGNATGNPQELDILVFPGQNHTFLLYEDEGNDCSYLNGDCFITEIVAVWDEQGVITLSGSGNQKLVPDKRKYRLLIRGCREAAQANIRI